MISKEISQSIRFRFLSIVAGILVVGTVILSSVIAINERRSLRNSLVSKGQSFASYIAKLSQDPLIIRDGIQLDSIVNEANKDEDIVYAVIHDAKGGIVTSQYASINYRLQRLKPMLSRISKDSEVRDIIAAIRHGETVAEQSAPIMAGADVIGKVVIGMSEHKIRNQILFSTLFVVVLNLGVASALGFALFAASKKLILDPLVELSHAADRIAKGNLSTRVERMSRGEMGLLSDSFNHMAEELDNRTRELLQTQEELVRKEKLSILGQLSGSVGHELRNPLGVMSNAVYFLKLVLTEADETTKEYLGIIEKEIANSERIITDLLDFARTKTPQARGVTVRELVDHSLGRCAVPDRVAVSVEIPETLPLVRVDPHQMGQVLTNFITNAVQAMPEGGAVRICARQARGTRNEERENYLEPRTSNLGPDADFVEISISDTGVGITPEGMERLFQPLFTTKPKGVGLGLTVCRNLTEANGGRIGVASRLGEGTTFSLMLPVERSD